MVVVRVTHINTKMVSFPYFVQETLPAPKDTIIKYTPM
jgi:hypothetical protein